MCTRCKPVEQSDHAKNGGVIRAVFLGGCQLLDFLKGKRPFRLKENIQNVSPARGDAQSLVAQPVQHRVRGKGGRLRVHGKFLSQPRPRLNQEASNANSNPLLPKELFCLGNGIAPEMKNTGRQDGIRVAAGKDFCKVAEFAGPSARDHRNLHRLADRSCEIDVVASAGSVCIHASDRISPAPSRPTSRAQATASRSVGFRPPCV